MQFLRVVLEGEVGGVGLWGEEVDSSLWDEVGGVGFGGEVVGSDLRGRLSVVVYEVNLSVVV